MSENVLRHLPKEKQEEIYKVLEVIRKEADPVKVILFGSQATGKPTESTLIEDGITLKYVSDYDFLVVTKDNSEKEHQIISNIENRCNADLEGYVSIIVHSIDYINTGLSYGQYFFIRILSEGITLYDTGTHDFIRPTKLTPEQLWTRSQDYFNIWFPMANEFLVDAKNAFDRGSYRISAFYLHQATENLYATMLLVFSGFKPTTHNLQKLRNYAKHLNMELYTLFLTPINNDQEIKLFDLLKKGYIEARYKKEYDITQNDCELLLDKINQMKAIVMKACLKQIESIR